MSVETPRDFGGRITGTPYLRFALPRLMAEDLAGQRVTQRTQFYCLLLWAAAVCPNFFFMRGLSSWPPLPETGFANIILIVLGVLLCYRANTEGDDEGFLVRFICLGLPVGVVVYGLVMVCGAGIADALIGSRIEQATGNSLKTVYELLSQLVYFLVLRHWIAVVAARNSPGDGSGAS